MRRSGDGEQARHHFVTTFIEGLEGIDAVNRATVQIRQRYEASVPRVVGQVSAKGVVFVEDARTPPVGGIRRLVLGKGRTRQ